MCYHACCTTTAPAARRMLLNGDKSQWDRALGMPHYNATEMPAVSFETACHLVQWCRNGRFTLFDYGTFEDNQCAAYIETTPL